MLNKLQQNKINHKILFLSSIQDKTLYTEVEHANNILLIL